MENGEGVMMEDDAHLISSGPPASRTVIDNLKRLLTQRQHSRESDAENKEVVASTGSDLESDLSFYSLFTSTSSDSDLDYLHTSPERRKNGKRRPKRNLSTSSTSSSASLSPVRERRKRPKTVKRPGVNKNPKMIIVEDWSSKLASPVHRHHSPISGIQGAVVDHALAGNGNIVNINIMMNPNAKIDDEAEENASSSNKESMTDGEEDQQGLALNGSGNKVAGDQVRHSGTRLRKTKRDRNRRRNRKIHHHHHHHRSHHLPRVAHDEAAVDDEPADGGRGNPINLEGRPQGLNPVETDPTPPTLTSTTLIINQNIPKPNLVQPVVTGLEETGEGGDDIHNKKATTGEDIASTGLTSSIPEAELESGQLPHQPHVSVSNDPAHAPLDLASHGIPN